MRAIIIGCILMVLLSLGHHEVFAQEPIVPQTPLPTTTVKKISFLLKGSEREQKVLEGFQKIIKDILDHSEFVDEKALTPEGSNVTRTGFQELEIVISTEFPRTTNQPYKVSLVLRKDETETSPRFFEYTPSNRQTVQPLLKAFLTQELNLTAKSEINSGHPMPKLVEVGKVEAMAPSPIQSVNDDKSLLPLPLTKNVSAGNEIQLKKLTPTVKNINIKLEGSIREQVVLERLQQMVNDILNSSKLEVLSVPVSKEPVPTPAIKLYENLEIVIQVKLAENVGQPHKVYLILQELGKQGKPVSFNYYPKEQDGFYKELQVYLTEKLNLSPRSAQ